MPMQQFRHRPLHVTAIQFKNNTSEVYKFLSDQGYAFAVMKDPRNSVKDEFLITTDRGELRLVHECWLVLPPKGQVLLYRPDVFEMMYEVDD